MKRNMAIERFVIRQNVKLINNSNEWIDISSFLHEHEAWDSFDKAKKKTQDIALVKIQENQLG